MTTTTPENETTEDADGLIIRPISDQTLADVLEAWSQSNSYANVHVDKVNMHLEDEEPTIEFGEHTVPATEQGIEAIARFLGMPVRYVLDVPADEQQFMFEHRIQRHGDERLVVEFTSAGIESAVKSGKTIIRPYAIAEKVADWMPIESPVRDFWATPSDLRLDTYLPVDWDGPGIGGDPQVGDITHGGIRVFQNRKQNLAPGVRTFMYRLVCTNGMEILHEGASKIDARGKDDVEVVEELGFAIRATMDLLESDIRHFYDMRSQRIDDDRTGVFRRVAQDAGISDRAISRMEDRIAVVGSEPTMFDFANLITNAANADPTSNMARSLQRAGGSLVADHTARCPECHHRL